MPLDHLDYIKLVTETYKSRRVKNELSNSLTHPTYSKIKKECLVVYKKRYEKKDEKVLRTFFDPQENGKDLLQLIKACDSDKFKPLNTYLKNTYLKKDRGKTDNKNVDLLAWLIDFRHRPFAIGNNFQLTNEELALIKDGVSNGERGLNGGNEPENPVQSGSGQVPDGSPKIKMPYKRFKRAVIVFLILVICTGGIYTVWQQTKDKQMMMGNANTGCMYWSSDHYEKVPCNEDPKGRLILPLNEEKMKNFKRITKEDTITERSIGKVHYIKDNGVKFYTEGGNYPENVTRNLKPLSRYIYDKYLGKKETPGVDSLAEQN